MLWTPAEAAAILDSVFACRQYGIDDGDPVAFEVLARNLDSEPEYLEATWFAWGRTMTNENGWTPKLIGEARYWLDVHVIGDLANLQTQVSSYLHPLNETHLNATFPSSS